MLCASALCSHTAQVNIANGHGLGTLATRSRSRGRTVLSERMPASQGSPLHCSSLGTLSTWMFLVAALNGKLYAGQIPPWFNYHHGRSRYESAVSGMGPRNIEIRIRIRIKISRPANFLRYLCRISPRFKSIAMVYWVDKYSAFSRGDQSYYVPIDQVQCLEARGSPINALW